MENSNQMIKKTLEIIGGKVESSIKVSKFRYDYLRTSRPFGSQPSDRIGVCSIRLVSKRIPIERDLSKHLEH